MELGNWVLYLLAVTGLTLTPGPNGLLALTHGAIYGRRKTLSTIIGGSVGFATVIALSMFGIGALLAASV
jgi:threonine/homoserine/homoserine lactone efflux protein